ncbi:MAG: ATP-binding protein [Thermosynechococcaceae cyanobacterium]
MFQATRRRLALWYTAVTAVLLLLFAIGFYGYVRATLIERVDDTLHHVVEVVERSLTVTQSPSTDLIAPFQVDLEASFRHNSEAVDDDRIDLEWFNPTGELLWSTFLHPLSIPIHLAQDGETVKIDPAGDEPSYVLRQVTERLEYHGNILGYLRVSHPWFEVAKPTRALITELAIGLSLMIVFVAAVGWFLSQLAIEPLRASYQHLRQFTADASHELRNPLALIQTTVQVALSDPDITPQEQRQQLEVVERLTQRLGSLVNDLLFLARQESGMVQPKQQPCPLDALLMAVLEEQSPVAAAQNIQLTLDLGDREIIDENGADPFTVLGDDEQLIRLFSNLVSNSLQHTPTGGLVQLKLEPIIRGGITQLQVQVRDTGVGIPEPALPHIFERFYRVDPSRPRTQVSRPAGNAGTGLGLAIAKAICDTHHGQIRVESKVGQGTTFKVMFPQADAKL